MLLLQTETANKADRTSIPYAIDRQKNDLTLQDITRAAIHFLSQKDTDGFFLMVEGGKIDWACHSNDAATAFKEVIDMDNAIKVAYEFYEQHPDETLIIITADHETGGIVLGTGKYELRTDLLKYQKQSAGAFSKMIAAQHQKEGKSSRGISYASSYRTTSDFGLKYHWMNGKRSNSKKHTRISVKEWPKTRRHCMKAKTSLPLQHGNSWLGKLW